MILASILPAHSGCASPALPPCGHSGICRNYAAPVFRCGLCLSLPRPLPVRYAACPSPSLATLAAQRGFCHPCFGLTAQKPLGAQLAKRPHTEPTQPNAKRCRLLISASGVCRMLAMLAMPQTIPPRLREPPSSRIRQGGLLILPALRLRPEQFLSGHPSISSLLPRPLPVRFAACPSPSLATLAAQRGFPFG